MQPGRFHVTLTAGGRTMVHGWWSSATVAREKYIRIIGEYGALAGARVTLTDEASGETLTTWPDEGAEPATL
jgi:hypothetical protein